MTMERVKECVTDAAKELGYPEMKPKQLEVAATFIEGRDDFAVLPTGFGKSLWYACLPLAFVTFLKKERGYSHRRGPSCVHHGRSGKSIHVHAGLYMHARLFSL